MQVRFHIELDLIARSCEHARIISCQGKRSGSEQYECRSATEICGVRADMAVLNALCRELSHAVLIGCGAWLDDFLVGLSHRTRREDVKYVRSRGTLEAPIRSKVNVGRKKHMDVRTTLSAVAKVKCTPRRIASSKSNSEFLSHGHAPRVVK